MNAKLNIRDYSIPVISTEKEEDFRNVIRHTVANGNGANIVFILGTTGEFYAIPLDHKKFLIDIAIDEMTKLKRDIKNPIKPLELTVGITGEDLDETLDLAQYVNGYAKEGKVDYAILMPGYITRTQSGEFTRRGIPKNVNAVLEKADEIKLILYTHSGMTDNKNMRTTTWKRLATNQRIPYLKVSATTDKRVRNYQRAAHGNAKVLVGDADLALRIPSDGGVIGDGNILPVAWGIALRRNHDMDILEGDLADQLLAFREVYIENAIGSFKYILTEKGVISSLETFDPNLQVSGNLKTKLDQLLKYNKFNEVYKLNFN